MSIYITILFISALINCLIGFYCILKKNVPGINIFALLMFAVAEWSFSNAVEYYISDISLKILFTKISYIGLSPVGTLFILFSVAYTNKLSKLKPLHIVLLFAFPVIVLFLTATNEWHYLYWSEYILKPSFDGKIVVFYKSGIFLWALVAYIYACLFVGIILMYKYTRNTPKVFRHQIILIFIAAIFPWIGNLLYVLRLLPFSELDTTPIGFTLSGIILFFAIINKRLFNLVPKAKEILFDSMVNEVIVLDSKLKIIDFNPAANKSFNLDNTLEKNINNISNEIYKTLLEKNNDFPIRNECMIFVNNKNEWFDISISEIKDKSDIISGYLIILNNITERKINQEKLQNSELKLRESNATKDKYFSILAHDLRGNIGTLKNMSELLYQSHKDLNDDEKYEFYELINHSTQSLYYLLENLLTWSRSQRGLIEYQPEHIPIKLVINNVFDFNKENIMAKNLNFITNIKEGDIIFADVNMLMLIIRNLTSNAIKFSYNGGTISVNFKKGDNTSTIIVSDTGVGISKDKINDLFRIDKNTSTKGTANEKGSGLGLILCKEFIEKHGGKIWVESEEGKGSSFYITLSNN